MASTYTANTGIEKIGSGEQAGAWGTTTNINFDIIDDALNGVLSVDVSGAVTLTTSDGAASNGHHKVILLTDSVSSAFNVTIAPNDVQKLYFIKNSTDQIATVLQGGGSGTTLAIAAGASAIVYADGAGANANVGNISTDLLGDTSPQLGGNLDVNGKLIKFGDAGTAGTDDTLEFGADDDLQLYHDGTNSFIANKTGALKVATETSGIAVTIGHTTSETTIADNVTVTGNASVGGTLGVTGNITATADLSVGDDLTLGSDSAVIAIGADGDTTLTHTDGSGLTLNSTNKLMFNDASQFIQGSSATVLSLGATDEIDLTATAIDINGTCDISGNTAIGGTLGVTGALTENSAQVKVVGKETIWIPSSAMYPNNTNGCAPLAQVELSNGPEIKVLDFDASSDENAQFSVAFPKSWNEGTLTFQAFFTVTGTDSGTVAWGLSAVAIADNDSCNTAFGTNVVATAKAHSTTSNDLDVSAESGTVTVAGSPGVDELVFFQVMRDVSADDQTGDARLLGIKLFFTTDAKNDA
tara:strand:+ start:270 stop:1850 length:1581 start_codon:yes stop_codon:yes gene_type:complete